MPTRASVRRATRDDRRFAFDVPAAVLCAFCGQRDCAGCAAADEAGSGVVGHRAVGARRGGDLDAALGDGERDDPGRRHVLRRAAGRRALAGLGFALLAEMLAVSR